MPNMDMKQMMKQAQKMQAEMEKAQAEIANLTAEAVTGGGMVKAVACGDGSLQSIQIAAEAVDPEDVEMLEDLVLTAVNEALRAVSEQANLRMSAVTGGLKIPGF